MQKLPVSKAAEGMVLAKPVTRESGVVLMGEGTTLNAQLIDKLRDLEVQKIVVKGRPLDLGGDAKTLPQLLQEVEERFSTNAADKFCTQIKELVKKDITRRKQEEDL